MGTPSYMSPEQARGLAVDHRADLFSLGAVLYQMTTGRRPFSGSDTFAVLTSLATDTPPAPIAMNKTMPPRLSELIVGLLAKDPAERKPASAQDVSDELAAITRRAEPRKGPGEPGGADLPGPSRGSARRRRTLLAIAAVLFLGLAALAVANGPTIIRIANNEGELIVEVDDDTIEVVVKGTTVEILDPKGKRYLVSAGKDGEVEIREKGTDSVLVTEKFRVKRGDKVVVSVSNDRLATARKKDGVKPKDRASSTAPKLPAGDSPPAKDAFPGKLAFYDTFDDPKATTLLQGQQGELEHAVKNGLYTVTWPNAKAGQWFANVQSPPVYHSAFATRLRVENGGISITFRNSAKGTHRQWLTVVIEPDGKLHLIRNHTFEKDGKADPSNKPLAERGPDPALASGQWVTVAGRADSNDFEMWINGQLVARGTDDGTLTEASDHRGVALMALPAADGRSRIEVDYLAVWDLSAPKLPVGDSPPAKDVFGGKLSFYDTFDDPKACTLFQGTREGSLFAVEKGLYSVTMEKPKPFAVQKVWVGTQTRDTAFATRVRVSDGRLIIVFHYRKTAQRNHYLCLNIYGDGSWELLWANVELVNGEWVHRNHQVLKESKTPNPKLASGQWINIAGRDVGNEYDIWLNGQSIAHGKVEEFGTPSENAMDIEQVAKGSDDPARLDIEYAAVWDLSTPKLPVGDSPPAMDAFPGELVFYDTFDDPKACKLPLLSEGPIRAVVREGRYSMSTETRTATGHLAQSTGRISFHQSESKGAFAVRMRAEAGSAWVNFRLRAQKDDNRWLSFNIGSAGTWVLSTSGTRRQDGKSVPIEKVVVAREDNANPDLATGKWVNVVGRWSNDEYELWLNGKRVAGGIATDLKGAEPVQSSQEVRFGVQIPQDGQARFDIDYAAVWDQSATTRKLPAGDSPPAKDAFPGELIAFDTFEDPNAKRPQFTASGPGQAVIRDGRYSINVPEGKGNAGPNLNVVPGPPIPGAASGAFAARVRVENAVLHINLGRGISNNLKWNRYFRINPDGRWQLGWGGERLDDGKWNLLSPQLLFRSNQPDAELAAGNWVNVAVRWGPTGHEEWLNGRSVLTGTWGGPDQFLAKEWSNDVSIGVAPQREGPYALEVDYVAIWRLPTAPTLPAGDSPPAKE